jgi:hypothetical protein
MTDRNRKTWDFVLPVVRVWLGYQMFMASYSSVVDIIFHPKERPFFRKWFGEEDIALTA